MTLFEIIDAVQSGKGSTVDRRELEHAVSAMQSLHYFTARSLNRLAEKEIAPGGLATLAKVEADEEFRRYKAALAKSPTEWLGPNNVPESPECQKRRAASFRIFEKATGEKLD